MLKTDIPDVGWTRDDGKGPTIDLRASSVKVSETFAGDVRNDSAIGLGEYFKTRIFNIEVDGFHTYYVGEVGVLVHCPGSGASAADSLLAAGTEQAVTHS